MSFWQEIIEEALSEWTTPFFLSAWNPVRAALKDLEPLEGTLPLKHWLSFKTHPLAPLIRAWRDSGYGIEVVSEYEFLAAEKEGFKAKNILVNGVAKHAWLPRYRTKGIRVHFDSLQEVHQLVAQARDCQWRTGVRFHVAEEYDPDEPAYGGQFGMIEREAITAIKLLQKSGVSIESIHFHLRSNISSADSYQLALSEAFKICRAAEFYPTYVDCGGGLPVPGEWTTDNTAQSENFDFSILHQTFLAVPEEMPSVREIWMENGKFVTARSAVLVVRVLDIKERPDSRYLVCDGGRTNHALASDWEVHDIFTLPQRKGPSVLTTVCGPTCMAFDRLTRTDLPQDIEIGDYIVWMNAGAYHIPWETRFSNGLAKVLWCNEQGEFSLARDAECFSHWWGQWL